jgi:hypothetical protein
MYFLTIPDEIVARPPTDHDQDQASASSPSAIVTFPTPPSENSITPDQIVARPPTHNQDRALASSHSAVVTFPIAVRLPSGNSITLQVLRAQTIQVVKSQIEAAEPVYPAPHQRPIVPGHYDDLLDDQSLPIPVLRVHDLHLVLRGTLMKTRAHA